jgi:hypothetical protein
VTPRVRPGGTAARRRTLARRLLTPARAAGLLGMLVAGLMLRLLTGTTSFGLGRVEQPALHWTPADVLVASIAVPLGANVFSIETGPIEARLRALPAVASARVSVSLPDALVVEVGERQPILAWAVGQSTFLVDRDGALFAIADAAGLAAAKVPTIVDARTASPGGLAVGARLDAVDLDVATRLGALVPSDVGSAARSLQVSVGDDFGYVVGSGRGSWVAVFGFYSPTLRSTDLIPGQVQLLRSLLAGREAKVARVILADDHTGTYVPKPTSSH